MATILISSAVSLIAIVGFIYFTVQDRKQDNRPHSEQSNKN